MPGFLSVGFDIDLCFERCLSSFMINPFEFLVRVAGEFLSFAVPMAVTKLKSVLKLVRIGLCPQGNDHESPKQEESKAEFEGLLRSHQKF